MCCPTPLQLPLTKSKSSPFAPILWFWVQLLWWRIVFLFLIRNRKSFNGGQESAHFGLFRSLSIRRGASLNTLLLFCFLVIASTLGDGAPSCSRSDSYRYFIPNWHLWNWDGFLCSRSLTLTLVELSLLLASIFFEPVPGRRVFPLSSTRVGVLFFGNG